MTCIRIRAPSGKTPDLTGRDSERKARCPGVMHLCKVQLMRSSVCSTGEVLSPPFREWLRPAAIEGFSASCAPHHMRIERRWYSKSDTHIRHHSSILLIRTRPHLPTRLTAPHHIRRMPPTSTPHAIKSMIPQRQFYLSNLTRLKTRSRLTIELN